VQHYEAPLTWRKSRYCGTNACVEVAEGSGAYHVRDGKTPEIELDLQFSQRSWAQFLNGIKAGFFDR